MFRDGSNTFPRVANFGMMSRRVISCALSITLLSGGGLTMMPLLGVAQPAAPTANAAVVARGNVLSAAMRNAYQQCDRAAYAKARQAMADFIKAQQKVLESKRQAVRDLRMELSNLLGDIVSTLHRGNMNRIIAEQMYYDRFLDGLLENPGTAGATFGTKAVTPLTGHPRINPALSAKLKAKAASLNAALAAYAAVKPTDDYLKGLERDIMIYDALMKSCQPPATTGDTSGGAPSNTTGGTTPSTSGPSSAVKPVQDGMELMLGDLKRYRNDCDKSKYDRQLKEINEYIDFFKKKLKAAQSAYSKALKTFMDAAYKAYPDVPEGGNPAASPEFTWPTFRDSLETSPERADALIKKYFEKEMDAATGVDPVQRKAFDEAAAALRKAGKDLADQEAIQKYLDRFETELLKYPYKAPKECDPPKKTALKSNWEPVTGTGKTTTVAKLVSQAEFVDDDTEEPVEDTSVTYVPKNELVSVAVFEDKEKPKVPLTDKAGLSKIDLPLGEDDPEDHEGKESADGSNAQEQFQNILLDAIAVDTDPTDNMVEPGDQFIVSSPHHEPRTFTVPEEGVTDKFMTAITNGVLSVKPMNFVTGNCQDQQALQNIQRDMSAQGISWGPNNIMVTPMPMGFCQVAVAHYDHPAGTWPDFSSFPHYRVPEPPMQGGAPQVKPNPGAPSGSGAGSGGTPPSGNPGTPGTPGPSTSGSEQGDHGQAGNPGETTEQPGAKPEPPKFGDIPNPGMPGWYEPEQPRAGFQRNPRPATNPNDPLYHSQGSWAQQYDDMWALKRVGMTSELLNTLPSKPVTVAVVDSGIDLTHPELVGQLWKNQGEIPDNGVDDDRNGYVDDVHGWSFINNSGDVQDRNGHGTVVAGIIAAQDNNALGITGLFPHANIMPVQATDFDNSGGSIALAKAIVYAVDNGAPIINVSVGGPNPTWVEQKAIEYALSKGVLVVAATGNDGKPAEDYAPAGLKGVLAVGSSDLDNERALFSNWGRHVDVAAPGVDVLSLRSHQTDFLQHLSRDYILGTAVVGDDQNYYRSSGSSFSAPLVAATAALLHSQSGGTLTRDQLYRKIVMGAQDIGWPGRDGETGYGLLNVPAALAAPPDQFLDISLETVRSVKTPKGVFLEIFGTVEGSGIRSSWLELAPTWEVNDQTIWQRIPGEMSRTVTRSMILALPVERFKDSSRWTLRMKGELESGQQQFSDFQLELQ